MSTPISQAVLDAEARIAQAEQQAITQTLRHLVEGHILRVLAGSYPSAWNAATLVTLFDLTSDTPFPSLGIMGRLHIEQVLKYLALWGEITPVSQEEYRWVPSAKGDA